MKKVYSLGRAVTTRILETKGTETADQVGVPLTFASVYVCVPISQAIRDLEIGMVKIRNITRNTIDEQGFKQSIVGQHP